jgi:phosphohistidine phosphatase
MSRRRRKREASLSPVALANLPGLEQSSGMRRLFLVRHAKAEPAVGRDDYDRALIGRGRDDARRVASVLGERDMLPDVLIHSGARRAKETAEIFAAQWPREVELQEEPGLYDATLDMLFARTRALPNSRVRVAFVGHNPGLGELAATLAGSGAHSELRRLASKYPTCAVAALDFRVRRWEDVELESGLLALYLTPSELGADTD